LDGALPIGAAVVTSTSVNALLGAPTQEYWALAALNDINFDISVPWYTNAFSPGGQENEIVIVVVVVHDSVNDNAKVTEVFSLTTSILTPTSSVMLKLCVELNVNPRLTDVL
jgi:hypothetical protein